MTRLFVLLGVALLAMGGIAIARVFFPPDVESPPPVEPKPQRKAHHGNHYSGVVAAIGPDWVELAVGWKGEDGASEKWLVENKKPKRLSAEGTKHAGNPDGESEAETYLLHEVKVGDVV